MRCIDPRPVVLGRFGNRARCPPCVARGRARRGSARAGSEVGVDFVEGSELGGGEGSAVEVGCLEDEAGVGRRLEIGYWGGG